MTGAIHILWVRGEFSWADYRVFSFRVGNMCVYTAAELERYGNALSVCGAIPCWSGHASDPEAALRAAS